MSTETVAAEKSTDVTPAIDGPVRVHHDGGYRIQLDGIRAFAVLFVAIHHFLPATEHFLNLGDLGVRVFFVLSGYLITGILLQARTDAEQVGETRRHVLLAFYARRFVRIFPVFYAVIIATCLMGSRPMRESWVWHSTYLSNVYFFLRGTGNDSVTHLWSLAVEEQFYLFWPFLMLFLPRRALMPAVIATIAVGPLFRVSMLLLGKNEWQASVLTPACLDTLGIGALLAILFRRLDGAQLKRLAWIALAIGLPLMLVSGNGRMRAMSPYWLITRDLAIGLFSCWLIHGAAIGFRGVLGGVLSFRPMVYLGMISYGFYLYHNFVPGIVARLLHGGSHEGFSVKNFLIYVAVTIVVATLSWFAFEKPINSLKRHFPYVRRKPRLQAQPSTSSLA